jgi:hypothetical protein
MNKFTTFLLILIFPALIKAQDSLQPPQNLQADVFGNFVSLSWTSPPASMDYLSWENGFISTSVGITSGGTFSVAAKWEPQQIPGFIGESIQKVSIHTSSEISSYTLKIWKGNNAETLVYSQPLEGVITNNWFDIVLDTLITIDSDIPVWVGYEVEQPAGEFPATVDSGPAVEGYGDLVYFDNEWVPLTFFGLSNNFLIRAYTTGTGEQILTSNLNRASTEEKTDDITAYSPFIQNPNYYAPESISELQGFNVYVDGNKINETPISVTSFAAGTYDPGTYLFGVSAVYEEGESEPTEIEVVIGSDLITFTPDFLEINVPEGEVVESSIILSNIWTDSVTWQVSTFTNWILISDNQGTIEAGGQQELALTIDATNLAPGYYFNALEFTFNDVFTPTSYYQVFVYVEGEPSLSVTPESLDFGNVETGATKTMNLQLFNDGQSLISVDSIKSTTSQFIVENQSFQLSPYQHQILAVAFIPDSITNFTGEIQIYTDFAEDPVSVAVSGSGVLAAPLFLNAQVVNENDAELTWLAPGGFGGTVLSWDNGENGQAIGYGAEYTFSYGARWTPEFLENAAGLTAISVSFFPFAEESTYTLKIYEGENASNQILSQPVTNYVPYEWNAVNINTPFEITANDELWVTFEVNNASDEYPAGADSGPAVAGFGDMISEDGVNWVSMSQFYGLSHNWNIQLFATDQISSTNVLKVPRSTVEYENQAETLSAIANNSQENRFNPYLEQNTFASNFEFLGYNVYRNNQLLNGDLLTDLEYTDPGLENGIYEYGVTAVYDIGESPQTTDILQIGTPEISFDPASLDIFLESGTIITDTIMISNSGNIPLIWEASSNASFIIPEQSAGTIEPGSSAELPVTIDATFIGGGTINAGIVFNINNLNNPLITYPVTITVEGSPSLFIYVDELNFGNTPPGTTKTRNIDVFNFGFGSAELFNFSTDNEAFFVEDTIIMVEANGFLQIPVQFTPEEVTNYQGTLSFSTTDPNISEVNISLAGSGYLMPPLALNAQVAENDVQLAWLPPDGGDGNYLQYDDGTNYTSIGLSGGGTFAVAAKWGPDQLINKIGSLVGALGFFATSETTSFTLMVWKGPNADSIIIQQPVTDYTPFSWNDVFLSTPFEIVENETYWFGYEVEQSPDEFPAGVDAGPAAAGYGDLVTLDGQIWESLTSYGLSYNWNIRAFLLENNGEPNNPVNSVSVLSKSYQNSGHLVQSNYAFIKQDNLKSGRFNELIGYNIYRDSILVNDVPVVETAFVDEDVPFGTYLYSVTALYNTGESNPAGPIEVVVDEPVQMPEGWEHNHTNTTHIIYVPTTTVFAGTPVMEEGDWIGAFYTDNGMEYCAGAALWHTNDTIKVVAFGDDPQTTQKEGFTIGEPLIWKAYMQASGDNHQLEVSYHSGMPDNDGNFNEFGLSMLTSIDLIPTAIGETSANSFSVYPNPGNGLFYISATNEITRLSVFSMSGQLIFENQYNDSNIEIDLSNTTPGIYYLKMETQNGIQLTDKVIIK